MMVISSTFLSVEQQQQQQHVRWTLCRSKMMMMMITTKNNIQWWWKECAWPGMGLFGESYLLFSIGTLQPLWKELFPNCYYDDDDDDGEHAYYDDDCSPTLLHSLTYSVVLGVIAGMMIFGCSSGRMGRRWGSLLTASIMAGGSWGMTLLALCWSNSSTSSNTRNQSTSTMFTLLSVLLFLFGFGVGGEYPLSASSASEKSMGIMKKRMELEMKQQQQQQDALTSSTRTSRPMEAEMIQASPTSSIPNQNPVGSTGHPSSTQMDSNHHDTMTGTNTDAANPYYRFDGDNEEEAGRVLAPNRAAAPTPNTLISDNTALKEQHNRGQRVQLVFMMQGMGIFVNCLVMMILLLILLPHNTDNVDNNDDDDDDDASFDSSRQEALFLVWQLSYALGAIILTYVLWSRWMYLTESEAWVQDQQAATASSVNQINTNTTTTTNTPGTPSTLGATTTTDGPLNHDDGGNDGARNLPWNHVKNPLMDDDNVQHYNAGATTNTGIAEDPAFMTTTRTRTTGSTTTPISQHPFVTSPGDLERTISNVSSLSAPSVVLGADAAHSPNRIGGAGGGAGGARRATTTAASSAQTAHHTTGTTTTTTTTLSIWSLAFRYYGWRLIGTSLSWLLWDVAFYGNKLFQSSFLLAICGSETTTLVELSAAGLLNAFVALLGYAGASQLLDLPSVGRFRLQLYGFLGTGILFVACGLSYEHLTSANTILVSLYLASSFLGQLGPNATTFLIPAEIFPTELRSASHGIAAASGKLGALLATLVFSSLDRQVDLFLLSGYCSLAAAVVTFWSIPDYTTFPDLYELDKQWRWTVRGRRQDYAADGPANQVPYLSRVERGSSWWWRTNNANTPTSREAAAADVYEYRYDCYEG